MPLIVPVKLSRPDARYDIKLGTQLLPQVASSFSNVGKVAIISDHRVFGLYGSEVCTALQASRIDYSVHLIPRGESAKSFRTLRKMLAAFSAHGINRSDAVIALGGGVVGDLAGFAASIHLRGVRCFQIPTTLLSVVDSSVGGKTGINTEFGKNLVGTFHQPAGVIADITTLATLPRREIMAGFMEAAKHAALAGTGLLKRTAELADMYSSRGSKMFRHEPCFATIEKILAEHIRFKIKVVRADETENVRSSARVSRKILNFGHTYGHALEKATNFRLLKHGEAVGWGLLFAGELSKKLELLDANELNLLDDVVHRFGRLPNIAHVPFADVLDALAHDKKSGTSGLQWILLSGIGHPTIVSGSRIPRKLLIETHRSILKKRLER